MRIKEMEQFCNQKFMKNVNAVRFDLRHKDVSLSARLLEAADKEDWTRVTALLEQGADPRICRISDGTTCESALYLAMKAKQFHAAEALYRAGDRLDDLLVGEFTIPADALQFLAFQSAIGRNYFKEEEKPLSECVRCGLWAQVSEKMETASKEELDLSAAMIGLYLTHRNIKTYLPILRDLKNRGADIAQVREEILEQWERFEKMPRVFHPDEECFRQIVEIVEHA